MNIAWMPASKLPSPAVAVAMALYRPGAGAGTGYYRWYDSPGTWGPFSVPDSLYSFPAAAGAFPADFYSIILADTVMQQADTIVQLIAIDAAGHPVATVSVETVNHYPASEAT